MEPGAIGALVAVALGRAAGGRLVRQVDLGEGGALQEVLSSIVDASARSLDGPVRGWIESLLPARRKQRLLESATWMDLAGLAWAEALSLAADDELRTAFGLPAPRIRQRLDALWFVDRLTSLRAQELGFALGAYDPREGLPDELVRGLVALLADEAAERLELEGDDEEIECFVSGLVTGLPERIARLFLQLPGKDAVLARIAAEGNAVAIERGFREVIERLDGTAAGREALARLGEMAQAMVGLADQDTFRRERFDDLPILVHRRVYVEPDAASASSEPGPAKVRLREAWSRADLVVLEAPFGMGKSLTCRDLAVDLASAWLEDPGAEPCPLLLDCPELLRGNVGSLQMAVLRHLEDQGLSVEAARWVWHRASLVVILDSFDEVVLTPSVAQRWIEDMEAFARRPGVDVLVASRPYGYERSWLGARSAVLELQQLTDPQAQRWLDRHAEALSVERRTFAEVVERLDDELARTPILLLMALVAWHAPRAQEIPGRAGLFARFLDSLATGKWKEVQPPHPTVARGSEALDERGGARLYQQALARVAWAHKVRVGEAEGGLPVRRLEAELERWHPDLGEQHLTELTRAVVLSLFFRKAEGTRDVRFTHRAFRDFLCARYLLEQLQWEQREPARRAFLLALNEAWIGEAEAVFLHELLAAEPAALRALALQVADEAIEAPTLVLLDEDGVRTERWGQRTVHVASDERVRTRSAIGMLSAEILGSRLRGYQHVGSPLDERWRVMRRGLAFDKHDGRVVIVSHVPIAHDLDATWEALALGSRPALLERAPHFWFLWEAGFQLDGAQETYPALQWRPHWRRRLSLVIEVGRHLAAHPEAPVPPDGIVVCVLPGDRWFLVPALEYAPDPEEIRRAWGRYAITALHIPGLDGDAGYIRLTRLLATCQLDWLEPPAWEEMLDGLQALADQLDAAPS